MGWMDAMGAASETTYDSCKCQPKKSNSAQDVVKEQQIDEKNSQAKAKKTLLKGSPKAVQRRSKGSQKAPKPLPNKTQKPPQDRP